MSKRIKIGFVGASLFAGMGGGAAPAGAADAMTWFVRDGRQAEFIVEAGGGWTHGAGWLEAGGEGRFLYASKALAPGDFLIRARLELRALKESAASVMIGKNHFGFDGRGVSMFVEGPQLGKTTEVARPSDFITDGKAFVFEARRRDGVLSVGIDGKRVWSGNFEMTEPMAVGLRPWRAAMRVYELAVEGALVEPPEPLTLRQALALSDEETGAGRFRTTIFKEGVCGYPRVRIPAMVVTPRGTILAFAEGRVGGDTGRIHTILRRSEDGGRTWGKQQVAWADGDNTCGNPCPVVDAETGEVLLLNTWNLGSDHEGAVIEGAGKDTRRVFLTKSADDGVTWGKPREITDMAKRPEWGWYATGPGNGVQLTRGAHKGRLVIPCDHSYPNADDPVRGAFGYGAHAIWSDDHGKTWNISKPIRPKTNECTVAERADGSLVMNMRSYAGKGCRAVAMSKDGGESWSKVTLDPALPEPVCQASLFSMPDARGRASDRHLFLNPGTSQGRFRMTLRLSEDGGANWPREKVLYPAASAYSSLAILPDGSIACLYEAGLMGRPYDAIIFDRVPQRLLAR